MDKNKNCLSIYPYKSNKNKLKQPLASELNILPKIHCSYLVIGKSGSGKSTTCLHLLNSKSLLNNAFDIVLYLSDSPDDLFKEYLKIPKENFITNMNEEWLNTLINKQKESVEKKGIERTKNILLIFDDILSKQKFLKSNILTKLVCECRHYNISCIFNTQYYKKVPSVVRTNCRGLILFPSSLSELEKFAEENCLPGMSKKRFLELLQHCTDQPYQFAFINHDAPNNQKLRKNFNTIIN